ncbi:MULTISPECIES: twin-arginine translocase TatA/TatE family subunit [unclassified Paenibacillus]|uniref:Sec-independent protein translocase protein TatA n=1 Tax=Paenibacillus provencensis TaxID=441151 RepID=A0ABW3PXC9_9BACL|nr:MULTISPECIES: twin-arginine translocase TatA/TatE family subunit [unclassified Paenibacillus]MCM3127682.1 twin-arginine translocase TatA/TatE family subunit [Paenibacillus sp. MER 78]SFS39279.1 sec-independent protein translocase protein TatA [Paenibacillus sp. 453mf]
MPSIGPTGFILIVVVALLLFGPNKLPELGRAVGRTFREFKNGAQEIMSDDSSNSKKESGIAASKIEETKATTVEDKRLPE